MTEVPPPSGPRLGPADTGKAALPALSFRRWRLALSAEEAAAFEAFLRDWVDAHGSTYGAASFLVRQVAPHASDDV